jgi:hypothetical protein
MPHRMTPALLLTSCLALVPSARADIFKYDVQYTAGTIAAHVIFELPSFEETVDNQTTFDLATWTQGGSPAGFSISGNTANCVVGSDAFGPGPCILFNASGGGSGLILGLNRAPAFSGPGTYTESSSDFSTTVIITDVPTVPEPSALVLLSSCLLGVGLVVRKRRLHQRPTSRRI